MFLKKEGFKFKFIFIGAKGNKDVYKYLSSLGENVEIIDELEWHEEGAVAEALKKYQIDIGVAPINEDKFSKAKCAFKIVEYMAVGLPVIVSPVGEQEVVTRDLLDGFHARGKEEWVKYLKQLSDVKLREKMGASGQKRIKESYSYKFILPGVYKEIKNIF
ncbi:hypothetical protein COW82_01410 [Candidatus Campbellbacteria bacterium CG22_combo_CG10-13_8_21_14_all_43_18]|uniref:Glycosyl transferase family 1 domain-containing protein n=1 Tax=Candidatus Campbellbacteria bacterium CG22_combo_CG10-13_8_21_14_all_43_18 TaxID=1974530 RepID=A0A2H0DWL7_9BACT|nr:MAG: hypothetical protein COW82_01410 [Candidatus Campbellbacteria bacterium CG22_combo_CG10-13_8_21_14_all_43_18]